MLLPSSVTPIRAFAQVKFPTSFLFRDKRGAIAEYISETYDEQIEISEFIAARSKDEISLFRADEDRMWISQQQKSSDENLSIDAFISWATEQFDHISKILNLSTFMTVGLRIYYLEEYSKVSMAVQSFKDTFINYSGAPYEVVSGSPTRCIIEFGVKDESIDKNFRLTPIHDERSGAPEDAGGILFDLDTHRDEIMPSDELESIFTLLKDCSFNTIETFIKEIRGESTDDEKVAEA